MNYAHKKETLNDIVARLMAGSSDLHFHTGPDIMPRRQDMLEAAEEARSWGLKAIVIKNHYFSTAPMAHIVNNLVEGVQVFGGVVLSAGVGGLNPHAVKYSLQMGAKTIWMPSLDSAWTLYQLKNSQSPGMAAYKKTLHMDKNPGGYSILKGGLEGTELLEEVYEILEIIAEYDAILETSHLSPRESLLLIPEAFKAGVKKVVCTHVNAPVTNATLEEQQEMAAMGAKLMYTYAQAMPGRSQQPQDIMEMIRAVGPEHCLLSTDFGRVENATFAEGYRMFIVQLLLHGFTEEEVSIMAKRNTSWLLGL